MFHDIYFKLFLIESLKNNRVRNIRPFEYKFDTIYNNIYKTFKSIENVLFIF